MRAHTLALLLFVVSLGSPADAQQRSLHWPQLEVEARLDAQGVLHVRELQVLEMSGDWNGGERIFNIGRGRLSFDALSRRDNVSGELVPLQKGSLSVVDQWDFTDRRTLRWRSRAPSDPNFDHQRLTYLLEYRLSEVLVPSDDSFRLDHDFAFADRVGVIEQFTLDLSLAPEWRAVSALQTSYVEHNLHPGSSFLVQADLAYTGADRPSAVAYPRPSWIINATNPLALAGIVWLWWSFRRDERPLGRWQRLETDPELGRDTVRAEFEHWAPEELGALWDQKIGPPEVAAVISRMVTEKKLESTFDKRGLFRRAVLELERKRPKGDYSGYEKTLISKLFFNNRRRVNTQQLRKHYKTKGLDLVKVVEGPIERALRRKLGSVEARVSISKKRTLWLILTSIALGAVDVLLRRHEVFGEAVHVLLFLYIASTVFLIYMPFFGYAMRVRRRVDRTGTAALKLLLAPVLMLGLLWLTRSAFGEASPSLNFTLVGSIALALWICGLASSLYNTARSRLTSQGVSLRRKFASIREWIARELQEAAPDLDDDWFPFLIAFGLDRRVDSWFKSFGGSSGSTPATRFGSTGQAASSFGGSGSSWTGGGGAFGGAGASAAWATAATGLAGGVAAASSGSGGSSGGGGGGGGSSGGGGGGGW